MYNVRRILTCVAVVMFIISIATAVTGGRAEPTTTGEAPAAANVPDAPAVPTGEERFVAHRGYSAAAPENTALAFELAGKAAFWGIETDISETYDNEFVCMHDDTIDRMTDGEGAVGDYT